MLSVDNALHPQLTVVESWSTIVWPEVCGSVLFLWCFDDTDGDHMSVSHCTEGCNFIVGLEGRTVSPLVLFFLFSNFSPLHFFSFFFFLVEVFFKNG